MIRTLTALALLASTAALAPVAIAEDDEIVRLPSQGAVRDDRTRNRVKAERLKPGGGLFVTFDTNEDGTISPDEISRGIPLAFASADTNEDGALTALEQQAWSDSLPTRDETLSNPVRFDPNLDRRVELAEFTAVISDLGQVYADEVSGNISIAALKAPDPEPKRRTLNPFDNEARPRGQRGQQRQQRNQSFGR